MAWSDILIAFAIFLFPLLLGKLLTGRWQYPT